MEGDTIVMGSDGLFDNVFDHEIVSTVAGHGDVAAAGMSSKIRRTCIWQSTSHFSNWDLISMLAKALANLASIHSTNSEFESPYSLEARSKVTLFGMITVLLSIKSSFQRVWCFFFFVNAPDRDLMFLSGRKFLAWSSLVKTYKDGFFFLNITSDQVLCLAGGKLDDITVIVGQVVRSQHISLLAEDQTVEAHTEQENKLES